MRRIAKAKAQLTMVAATAVGLGVSAGLVWQSSYSAFSATTANPTNTWNAGSVILADDDSNAALFTLTNLKPGDTGTKCIVVTSNGSLASAVKLYTTAGSFAQTKTLADNMTLTVTQGTSTSSNGDCNGFVADAGGSNTATGSMTSFSSTYTDFNSGFGTWAPAGGTGVQKTYQFTWTLNNAGSQSATDVMQDGTAQIGFTWEAQNT